MMLMVRKIIGWYRLTGVNFSGRIRIYLLIQMLVFLFFFLLFPYGDGSIFRESNVFLPHNSVIKSCDREGKYVSILRVTSDSNSFYDVSVRSSQFTCEKYLEERKQYRLEEFSGIAISFSIDGVEVVSRQQGKIRLALTFLSQVIILSLPLILFFFRWELFQKRTQG